VSYSLFFFTVFYCSDVFTLSLHDALPILTIVETVALFKPVSFDICALEIGAFSSIAFKTIVLLIFLIRFWSPVRDLFILFLLIKSLTVKHTRLILTYM